MACGRFCEEPTFVGPPRKSTTFFITTEISWREAERHRVTPELHIVIPNRKPLLYNHDTMAPLSGQVPLMSSPGCAIPPVSRCLLTSRASLSPKLWTPLPAPLRLLA